MEQGRKLRILQITTIPLTLRAFLLPFAGHFRRLGWEVDAMAAGLPDEGSWKEAFNATFDVRWSRRAAHLPLSLAAAAHVRFVVERGRYDVVHVHTPIAAFVTRLALRNTAVARVYTAHGFHFHPRGRNATNLAYLSAELLAGRWTDALVVINREDLAMAKRHQIADGRVHYIPGIGVDINPTLAPEHQIATLRRSFAPPDVPIFLMIAEFNPGKRHVDLLEAFGRMRERRAVLLLAGTGRHMKAAQERVAQLQLGSRVHFLGFRNDVSELIQLATATVLPSEREGLPRSVLEAMALGRPTIGADVRGIQDLLTEGAGILFPPGDVSRLTEALDWAASHPAELRRIGEEARRKVQEFSLEAVLAQYQTLFEELTSGQRADK